MITHNQDMVASGWVQRFLPLVPRQAGSFVLDYACGSGRHTKAVLDQGLQVLAVDQQTAMVLKLKQQLPEHRQKYLQVLTLDLEDQEFAPVLRDFPLSAIIVTNYLYRPHLPTLLDILAPGGILIYETFAVGNEKFGKPSNPDFLLKKDELWQYIQPRNDFSVISFEQGYLDTPKPAMIQRICAVKQNILGLQLQHEN